MSDPKFVDGLLIKPPHDSAPDFVKCSISIKRKELGNWLRNETEDWINLDVKVSKKGGWYAQVNDWKPDSDKKPAQGGNPDSFKDVDDFEDIPFMRPHDEYFG